MDEFLKLFVAVEAALTGAFADGYQVLVTAHVHHQPGGPLRTITASLHHRVGGIAACAYDITSASLAVELIRADLATRKAEARAKLEALAGEP
jgi:hypothetical protein